MHRQLSPSIITIRKKRSMLRVIFSIDQEEDVNNPYGCIGFSRQGAQSKAEAWKNGDLYQNVIESGIIEADRDPGAFLGSERKVD